MFFHEYFADFYGDFGVFNESDTYNCVPNKRPPFSLALKGVNMVILIDSKKWKWAAAWQNQGNQRAALASTHSYQGLPCLHIESFGP